LNLPNPKRAQPEGLELAYVDQHDISEATFSAMLQSGGMTALQYYGCWSIWRTENGFSGELLQYRQITESFTDAPLPTALETALYWASECYG
jgi:hypothetical protein